LCVFFWNVFIKTGKVVNIKKGQFASSQTMIHAATKVKQTSIDGCVSLFFLSHSLSALTHQP